MKYAVISNSNGTFKIESEWTDDKQGAFVDFHNKCKVYWNAPDVVKAIVEVVDENLDIVEGKREYITHDVEPNE